MDPATEHEHEAPSMGGLKSSLHTLISARIAIVSHELKQASRERAKAIGSILIAAMLAFFAWALLLAGSIAAIAVATGWPWHVVSLAFAALHLMAAILLVKSASTSTKAPAFPVTRSEFKKDCEWIESLQNKPNSRN